MARIGKACKIVSLESFVRILTFVVLAKAGKRSKTSSLFKVCSRRVVDTDPHRSMERDLHSGDDLLSRSSHPGRFPTTPAATPPRPPSRIDQVLLPLFLFVLSFLIVGALISVAFGSSSEEEEHLARRMKKKKKRGLDPARVTSFLLVPFGAVDWGREEARECAVCLVEFRSDEDLRVLPGCAHGYHAECIDPWLIRHATCPLCRNDLASPPALSPGRHVIDA